MTQQTYERAVASTECSTPIIGLNELLGPAAPVPWTANVKQYRANVLALVRGLAARGARPALLVHGNPGFAGEAEVWWRQVGAVADVVYEAYYNAPVIVKLGRVVGTRRIRMGMRSVADRFLAVGIPKERIGFVLGFQVALGAAGREGLQPSTDWYRFVKWNALAAREVATDIGASTIWSWGWANFGPQSVDPDKPTAACVYLWARDPALCDGPAAAGPGFVTSRVEGTITLPADSVCTSASGRIDADSLWSLTRATKSRPAALAALYSRLALAARVPVSRAEILAYEERVVERSFGGSRAAYVDALTRRGADLAVARGAIADQLRRARIASLLRGGVARPAEPSTVLAWSADTVTAEADTATCLHDELPGTGDFPSSNARDVSSAPLLMRLPFLGADDAGPAAPASLVIGGTATAVALDWADGGETDLLGYVVYRKDEPGAPFRRLTPLWLTHSAFVDRTAVQGTDPIYVVRSVDVSGNLGEPTSETARVPAP
jgi:hypothetical protein